MKEEKKSMENYLLISGAPLWVGLVLICMILICIAIVGTSYVKEIRENEYHKEKCHKLTREISALKLELMCYELKVGKINGDRSQQ